MGESAHDGDMTNHIKKHSIYSPPPSSFTRTHREHAYFSHTFSFSFTQTHTHTHTQTHTCIHACIHTYKHSFTQTKVYVHTYSHLHGGQKWDWDLGEHRHRFRRRAPSSGGGSTHHGVGYHHNALVWCGESQNVLMQDVVRHVFQYI